MTADFYKRVNFIRDPVSFQVLQRIKEEGGIFLYRGGEDLQPDSFIFTGQADRNRVFQAVRGERTEDGEIIRIDTVRVSSRGFEDSRL